MAATAGQPKASHKLRNLMVAAGLVVICVCVGLFATVYMAEQTPTYKATQTAQVALAQLQQTESLWTATPSAVPTSTPLPGPTSTPTTTPSSTSTPKPTITLPPKTATAAALGTSQAASNASLAAIAKQVLADKLISAQLVTARGYTSATIVYDDSVEFDENSMIDTSLRNMIRLMPAVFSGLPAAPDMVVLISIANFTDIHGQTKAENAVEIRITKALNTKMNWPNFDRRNTLNVLVDQNDDSAVMVNPALIKAWVASQNQ